MACTATQCRQEGRVVRRVSGMFLVLVSVSVAACGTSSTSSPIPTAPPLSASVCGPGTAGGYAQYSLPDSLAIPEDIVEGPDGNVWITSLDGKIFKSTVNGTVTAYTLPDSIAPLGITAGFGELWFDSNGNPSVIGSISTSGTITVYPLSPASSGLEPVFITADASRAVGSTGVLWFTDYRQVGQSLEDQIVELSVQADGQGGAFQEFPLPQGWELASADFPGLAFGPDGNLWFPVWVNNDTNDGLASMTPQGVFTFHPTPALPVDVALGGNGELWFIPGGGDVQSVYEMTTSGAVTSFPAPIGETSGTGPMPSGMALGSDGNIWVTSAYRSSVIRITPGGTVSAFVIPTGGAFPTSIADGPDGNLWFSLFAGDEIGRFSASDTITTFNLPSVDSYPSGITTGPDGNLWFTETGTTTSGSKIGRLDPMTGAIVEFPTPTPDSGPTGITRGPDGNLWFTETYANKIGRITPQGVITEFPIPTANSDDRNITSGPDGDLWFTETVTNKLGRITPQGVITEFSLPAHSANTGPQGLVAGPDGNLWLAQDDAPADTITRVTPSGVATQFAIPNGANVLPNEVTVGPNGELWFTTGGGGFTEGGIGEVSTQGVFNVFNLPPLPVPILPLGITSGPEQAVWFTDEVQNRIYSMTAAGAYRLYPIPSYNSVPEDITTGPDGNLWFTELNSDQIGCLAV